MKLNSRSETPQSEPLTPEELLELVRTALEDGKGVDLQIVDVREKTTVTDYMIVVSGNSTRHVKSLAEAVAMKVKQAGVDILGVEGESDAEWVLVDLADVLVHVMLPRTRAFYALEKLWEVGEAQRQADELDADAEE